MSIINYDFVVGGELACMSLEGFCTCRMPSGHGGPHRCACGTRWKHLIGVFPLTLGMVSLTLNPNPHPLI